MRIRAQRGEGEILARIGNLRVLCRVAAIVFGLMCLVSSPLPGDGSSFYSVGGSASSLQDPIADLAAAEAEDRGIYYSVYRVKKGDTVGAIAESMGVTTDSIISLNSIQNTRSIQVGSLLKVPSAPGILYTVKEGDSIESIAASYDISEDAIVEANGLLSPTLVAERLLFLPDARLPSFKLREINGDLFSWPIRGWVTSRYGWRTDPFTGARSFHNAIDIGASMGVPIGAAMEGRVADTGYSPILGNYVHLVHHSGYSSFYGHMSSISVKTGQRVAMKQTIGMVGSTGYSTGPHLHFSVFKGGRSLNPSIVLH